MAVAQIANPQDLLLRRIAVGLYAWLYAVYFGLVVLDVIYAGNLRVELDSAAVNGIFNEISDFLQFPFGLLIICGAAAFGATLRHSRAANLILASWLLPIGLLAVYLSSGGLLESSGLGTGLRLLVVASGSVLSMTALCRYVVARDSAG